MCLQELVYRQAIFICCYTFIQTKNKFGFHILPNSECAKNLSLCFKGSSPLSLVLRVVYLSLNQFVCLQSIRAINTSIVIINNLQLQLTRFEYCSCQSVTLPTDPTADSTTADQLNIIICIHANVTFDSATTPSRSRTNNIGIRIIGSAGLCNRRVLRRQLFYC